MQRSRMVGVARRRRLVGVAALMLLAGCSLSPGSNAEPSRVETVPMEGGSYFRIEPGELAAMLRSKGFTLVNVHVPYQGEIESTDAFIPYDEIAARTGELPASPAAQIMVYCRSGRMSTTAAEALVRLGYTNVWELDGGFEAWVEAGFPLANRGG